MLGGELDIIAHSIGISRRFLHQPLVRARNAFEMNIPVKTVLHSQFFNGEEQSLHRIIGIFTDGGRKKQPLYVIALVKIDGQLANFFGSRRRSRYVRAQTVGAVLTIVNTVVAEYDFEQRNAPSVGCEGVTAPRRVAVADTACVFPTAPRRGTGYVVFRALR